jgi:Cu(I)/Ag(I) efflux system membrane fusion protein/cobalt-zinc-cadmium efflux system membrane fusion protein
MTLRTRVAIVAAAVAIAVTAILGYTRRAWLWPPGGDRAGASEPAVSPAAASASPDLARGDVTIDPQRQQLIGVRLAPATREPVSVDIRTTGTVRYDETRQADINVKIDGWIRQLYVDYTGQSVQKDQPLFALYSPDLIAAQREYLLALKSRDQSRQAAVADASAYAERLVEAARQRLARWDLPPEEIAALEATNEAREAITFRAPAAGYVAEKAVVQGMHVTAGQTLYKLVDLSTVWLEADVYEQDVRQVSVGQRATVTLDSYPGETFAGRAIYVYPFVEEKSRTVKVRFQLPNDRGRLKPGMYANVQLRGGGGTALTVPANAVLDSGTRQMVFISAGDGVFTPRTVKTGRYLADRTEILDGLKEGEQVATSATFFLDSESQLRAGLQNYEAPAASASSPKGSPGVDIAFRSQPDPPTTGESTFEVAVKDATGQPLTDVDVSVQQFMPAMPTMNMPAMRSDTKLPHIGAGVYRGPAQVMMAGRWDVTVSVTKGGQTVGRKQFAVVAK